MAILLAATAGAYADVVYAEVVLESFEPEDPPVLLPPEGSYGYVYAGDPEYGMAVTEGVRALAWDVPDGWSQGMQSGMTTGWDWRPLFPEMSDSWLCGGKLLMDVTTSNPLANVPMSSGIQMAVFIQGQSNADPSLFGCTLGYRTIDAVYSPTLQTVTLEFDLRWDINGNPTRFPTVWTEEAGGWADMRIHVNVIAGATNAGIIIVDNIRVSIATPPPCGCTWGDYNNDFVVDLSDYTVWADYFGGVCRNCGRPVNIVGYTLWADNFGRIGPPTD